MEMRIPVPDGLPQSLKMSESEFTREARMAMAAKPYEMGRISAGLAAELAGLDRLSSLASLSRYSVPAINLRDEGAAYEIAQASKLGEA